MTGAFGRFVVLLLAAAFLAGESSLADEKPATEKPHKWRLYIGTYTSARSEGIYTCEFDARDGRLSNLQLAAATPNPSFLAISPNGRYVFAVNEVSQFEGKPAGAVTAFAIDPDTGKLTALNQQSAGGTGPCHIIVDKAGKHVLVANYGGGSVSVLPIADDGRLGEATSFIQHSGSSADPKRQTRPHAHSINLDAANRFAFVADLGLDKVLTYRFDRDAGKLVPHDPPAATVSPGAGPRHFDFHPNGRTAYLINELDSTLTAFEYDAARGVLKELHTLSTLPGGFAGNNSTADLHVHPSGRFVYGSNRGHDSIAIFAVDSQSGRLTAIGHESTGGKTPRNFALDPAGKWLLAENQDSNSIVVFAIDQETGKLKHTGESFEAPSPVCIQMLPLGR